MIFTEIICVDILFKQKKKKIKKKKNEILEKISVSPIEKYCSTYLLIVFPLVRLQLEENITDKIEIQDNSKGFITKHI